MKRLLLILAFVCAKTAFCQQAKFKHAFTEKDRKHLISEMRECLGYQAHMKFSLSGEGLFNSIVGQGIPASLEEIERLKDSLKGVNEDANVYLEISGNYSMLKMPAETEIYRNKAIRIADSLIALYPDSVTSYIFLAGLYNGAGQPDKVIYYQRKAFAVKPSYTDQLVELCNIYLLTGQLDSAAQNIRYFMKTWPDDHLIYSSLAVYYLQVFASKMLNGDAGNLLDSEHLLDMPMLEEVRQKNKGDKQVDFLYHVARQVLLEPAVVVSSVADTSFDPENIEFKLTPWCRQELSNAKTYFEKCLKGSDTSFYYCANKMLGCVHLLENQPKKAVPYLRKAIDLKPLRNCSYTSNSNEDYYNLLATYVILKDTAAYEKLMLEKIKVRPTINPNPRDYAELAGLYASRGKNELAKNYYRQAADVEEHYENMTDPGEQTNALVGLGYIKYMEGDLDGAMDYVNKAYKLNPKMWELYLLYASILIEQGDANNAYETLYILKGLHNQAWIKDELVDYFFVGE